MTTAEAKTRQGEDRAGVDAVSGPRELRSYEIVCPQCGEIAECDQVDIGVGMQQCGPYFCQSCRWVQSAQSEFEMDDDLEFPDSDTPQPPTGNDVAELRQILGDAIAKAESDHA